MKLRTKIHLFTTLLMVALLIVMNYGIFLLYEQLSIDTEAKQLHSRGEELLTALSKVDQTANVDTILRAYIPTNGAIRVLNTNGKEITSISTSFSMDSISTKIDEKEQYSISEVDGSPLIITQTKAIWINGKVVDLQLLQRLDDLAKNQQLLKLILVAMTVLIAIPILLSNMALSRIILRPLEQLILAMKKSETSGTYEKLEKSDVGKDELAEMGRTFNRMMEALETNYMKQQQFVSNASHEFKTPLTVIESYAKLLLRRGFTNEKVATEALEAIVNESTRMNNMIVQMLELAKYKERIPLSIQQLDVTHLLENTLTQMRQAYNRNFHYQFAESLYIITDEPKLKQLLFILLDNARKYSDERIEVSATKQTNSITISIRDYGVGIPQDQLPHLFDRFFRVSEDRNRKTGGTGLGLAIANEIAHSLQIKIEVESEVDVGTCFILHIPLSIKNEVESK
ncbi:cell wall metabolism sensor histidine kinase WalK [Lysinibacillus sp. BW-2-10]|uniref:sensor histidine kinase n=1 Tax=Lysinibacillus sp. BW-2-10 TaxID=2590030 RepID=UPI00117FD1AB|nr:ATP-binding protein [Lysinibacillus sp. BW-2-10]TSI10586.1 HAMP domain-containing histidine kinase [Lysinibacillus sp. BW-2-10]